LNPPTLVSATNDHYDDYDVTDSEPLMKDYRTNDQRNDNTPYRKAKEDNKKEEARTKIMYKREKRIKRQVKKKKRTIKK